MAEARVKSPGRLAAEMLRGSWRPSPAPFECSLAELEELAPLLKSSGAAALAWRRVRHTDLRDAAPAKELHQAYRRNVLRSALHLRTLESVIEALGSAGITPLLVKGWAAARLYPEPVLRSFGDIDVCVRPAQFDAAGAALEALPEARGMVDLHRGFEKFGGGDIEEVYSRAQSIKISEASVCVPCEEDHLRALCIHLLREGAWRPLWLCDVAAAVESRGPNFDWDRCLTGDRRRAGWVICALRLAGQLLGADICDTPAAEKRRPLPRWLVPAVLKEWGSPHPGMARRHLTPMNVYLRRPRGVLQGLRNHWPNPIEATAAVGGPFNDLPRLPFQLGSCISRTARFAMRLPGLLRQRR